MERFNVGDRVQLKGKRYLGRITAIRTVYRVENGDGQWAEVPETAIELATTFTPDDAWDQVSANIVATSKQIVPSKKDLRHQSYRMLGGAGVTVTDEVKERVKRIIDTLESALDESFTE